jgi:transcriptional regulator with XRE-family HTH domain
MSAVILKFAPMSDDPNRIREFRTQRGWSQSHLGELMGTSHVNISELERGVTQLTLGYMRRFAAVFGCAPGDLLLPEDNKASLSPDEQAWVNRWRAADPATREKLNAMADLIAPSPLPARERRHA